MGPPNANLPSVFDIFPQGSAGSAAPSMTSSNMMQPTERDVLCGKDKTYSKHPGNAVYRATIAAQSVPYSQAVTKQAKMNITKAIVEHMRTHHGARFLQLSRKGGGVWTEISDQQARDKTSHALRFHKQQQQSNTTGSVSPKLGPLEAAAAAPINNNNKNTTASAAVAEPASVPSVAGHHRVHSDLTVVQHNMQQQQNSIPQAPKSAPGFHRNAENNTLRSVDMEEVLNDVEQKMFAQENSNSIRSVDFCMNVLAEAAEQAESMDYQPSDTLRSEDLNRLFQMGDKEWDSVMNKQLNSNSVRSMSSMSGMGGMGDRMASGNMSGIPEHIGSDTTASASANNNTGTAAAALPSHFYTAADRNHSLMQSMDSVRSTNSTGMQQPYGQSSDTMRSEDLNRLFQMGEKEWEEANNDSNNAMEE